MMINLTYRLTSRALRLSLLLSLVGAALQAQDPNGSTVCGRAKMIALIGHPEIKLAWAMGTLSGCGAAGADAAASAFRTLRSERDTVVLDSLTWPLVSWRDAALWEAGTRLALDAGATRESRVFALRYLYSLASPGTTGGYGDFIRVSRKMCRGRALTSNGFIKGRPVPTDYIESLRALGNRISDNTANPMEVRVAASCLTFIPAGYRPPTH